MRHRLDGTEQSCEDAPDGSIVTYYQPAAALWRADVRLGLVWSAGGGPPASFYFTLWMPCSDGRALPAAGREANG